MVKHVIIWTLKDDIDADKKAAIAADIKRELEGLVGKIDGLLSVHVQTDRLPSSNADLMLDSEFESFEALKAYAVHPLHVAVADGYVRPYTAQRACIDFES